MSLHTLRTAAKVVGVLGSLALFAAHAAALPLFFPERRRRQRALAAVVHLYARGALRLLGVRVRKEGPRSAGGNAMLVSNHLSYVDVLVIASQVPSCFVTSLETRAMPGLGLLCRLAGCIFVDRRRLRTLQEEIGEVAEALSAGIDVAVFPEATSTDGSGVLKFRRALYQGAVDAGRRVQPLCLNYEAVDGRPLAVSNRDKIYWYGTMTFLPHLWELASCREVNVRLSFLPALCARETPDSRTLAARSHAMVKECFEPCLA